MKRFTSLARVVFTTAALFGTTVALADPMPLASYLTANDPTEFGRISRGGVPQDFAGDESFGGVINTTTPYHYHLYYVSVGATNFVTFEIDSLSATVFLSGYQSTYSPTNPGATWRGDPGSSSNYFSGTDPEFFSFIANPFSTVVLLINETTAGGGLGLANGYTLYAQGASDGNYSNLTDLAINATPPAVIPEPSSLLLLAPLALVVGLKSRRRVPVAATAPAV